MLEYYCTKFNKTKTELLDIFYQLRALSKFGSDYFRCRIRSLWYNGMNIPEIAKKYDTMDDVIKYAIMFSKKRAKIKGVMKYLFDKDPDLYEAYLEAYIKATVGCIVREGGAVMRVLSKKNKYYIPKERYLELKHFCLQYEDWQEAYRELEDIGVKSRYILTPSKQNFFTKGNGDVERVVFSREYYKQKIELVQNAAQLSDDTLGKWILRGVTEARDYNNLRLVLDMPCGKNTYYDRYRKFFWILDKTQNLQSVL